VRWLLWRQHRLQGAVAAAALAAFAAALWLTGVHMANIYHAALATCRANDTCDSLNLFQGYGAIVDLVNLSAVVPLLIGVFWGATLVGREIDHGTHTLVWTQSVSRRRWLRGKITLLLVAATVWGGAVAAIVTWWSGTPNSLYGNRFDPSRFDVQGIAPVAYALFAAALGLAAGAVVRRILPALAITVIGFVTVRIVVANYVRPHYLPLRVADVRMDQPLPVSGSYWTLTRNLVLNGQVISGGLTMPAQCAGTVERGSARTCLADLGYRYVVHYQPAHRYWTFQFIEAGLFVALGAVLVAVAVVIVRRRDA
jgi:hypothetical protein